MSRSIWPWPRAPPITGWSGAAAASGSAAGRHGRSTSGSRRPRPTKPWLCVVPRDAQEGEEIAIAGHDFDLLMGQPVVFPLASSSVRPDDKPGALVAADPDSIRELPPLAKPDARQPQGQGRARARSAWRRGSPRSARSSSGASRAPTTAAGGSRSSSAARPASSPPRGPVTGDESDRVVIEQSELDAAIAAIRPAFEGLRHRRRGSERRHGPGAAGEAARGSPRRAARPVAALGAAGLLGAAPRAGRQAAEEPAARVALVQPRGLLPAARTGLPAR